MNFMNRKMFAVGGLASDEATRPLRPYEIRDMMTP